MENYKEIARTELDAEKDIRIVKAIKTRISQQLELDKKRALLDKEIELLEQGIEIEEEKHDLVSLTMGSGLLGGYTTCTNNY